MRTKKMEIILPLFVVYIVVVMAFSYSRRLIILFLPLHTQMIYLSVSSLSLSRTLYLYEALFFIVYFSSITSLVIFWSAVFSPKAEKFKNLFHTIKTDYSLPLIPVVFMLFILYAIILSIYPDAIFQPRNTHKMLMEGNISGSYIFSLISIPAALASIYCVRFSNLLFVSGLLYLLGSKGFIINCWVFYMVYTSFVDRKINYSVMLIALPAFYGFINMNISGVDNALHYLIFSYFDYAENIITVLEVPLFINLDIFAFVMNDFVVGFSRITGVQRIELFEYYFPYEVSVGKNPGLLDAEIIFRSGFIFGWLILFLKYSFVFLIARLSLNSGYIFVAAATMVTVSLKISIALLLVVMSLRIISKRT